MMVEWIVFVICVSMGISLILTLSAIMKFRDQKEALVAEKRAWRVELWNVFNGVQVIFHFDQSVVIGRTSLFHNTVGTTHNNLDHTISREQCVLYDYSGNLVLWNLSSVNPTVVNGAYATHPVQLVEGTRLQMGNSVYLLTRIERL